MSTLQSFPDHFTSGYVPQTTPISCPENGSILVKGSGSAKIFQQSTLADITLGDLANISVSLRIRTMMKLLPKNQAKLGNPDHFNAENDHNPMVLPDCPVCRGYGKQDVPSEGGTVWTLMICSECDGKGFVVGGTPEHYFTKGDTPTEVRGNSAGWIKCPLCGKSFKDFDRNVFTGLRHKCGQKLQISEEQYAPPNA